MSEERKVSAEEFYSNLMNRAGDLLDNANFQALPEELVEKFTMDVGALAAAFDQISRQSDFVDNLSGTNQSTLSIEAMKYIAWTLFNLGYNAAKGSTLANERCIDV